MIKLFPNTAYLGFSRKESTEVNKRLKYFSNTYNLQESYAKELLDILQKNQDSRVTHRIVQILSNKTILAEQNPRDIYADLFAKVLSQSTLSIEDFISLSAHMLTQLENCYVSISKYYAECDLIGTLARDSRTTRDNLQRIAKIYTRGLNQDIWKKARELLIDYKELDFFYRGCEEEILQNKNWYHSKNDKIFAELPSDWHEAIMGRPIIDCLEPDSQQEYTRRLQSFIATGHY